MANASDIRRVPEDQVDAAWEAWATSALGTSRTAAEWRAYWEETVWPVYRESPEYQEDLRKEEEEAQEQQEKQRMEKEQKAAEKDARRKRRAERDDSLALDEPGAKRRSKAAIKAEPGLTQRQASVDASQLPTMQTQKLKREIRHPAQLRKVRPQEARGLLRTLHNG